jgi:hypothetical protein
MILTFLEAANGLRLSKRHCPKNGFTPYPHVKKVNSYEENIPATADGLKQLERCLRTHGDTGRCLLKGNLKRKLKNESRAGATDRAAYTNLLILDIDGLTLQGYKTPRQITSQDVAFLSKQTLSELPLEVQNTSYIAQASASLGLKGDKVSLHIFMFVTPAVPARSIKEWLEFSNFESKLFLSQCELSANGHSLKYPLDISVADNSKLIFIAPPTFEDSTYDPFASNQERIVRVSGLTDSLDLANVISNQDYNPQKLSETKREHKNELRQAVGFKRTKTEKLKELTINGLQEEVLANPDRMAISIANETYAPFICCNVNGGDSAAYYFNMNSPTYMYNFKGEPIWEIKTADPDFYKEIFDKYEKELEMQGHANYPVVLRDFKSDVVFNGLYDPNLKQFSTDYPLVPCNSSSVTGFMRSHGRAEPDFIPDGRVVFDPVSKDKPIQLETMPYYVNTYRKTKYQLATDKFETLTLGDSPKIKAACPNIYTLISHMLGGQPVEFEHFINWLASVFQTGKKTKTAWVLQGVPGTGKGIFYTRILRPLFGREYVPMRELTNIEEQFNNFMKTALFLVVDEFHMASASAATLKVADKLKNNISEDTVTIREMRSNQVEPDNYTNFLFLTNRPDAIKIEEGDRRYNVAPRQETPIKIAHPKLISNLNVLEGELDTFAAILRNYKYNRNQVESPIANNAKEQMKQHAMSVLEEFFAAVKHGTIPYFVDVLDIQLTNVMQSQAITTAQRFVKQWIAESRNEFSIIPIEHLRIVHGVLTETTLSNREFRKRAERSGLIIERRREPNATRSDTPVRGIVTQWALDDIQYHQIVKQYFDETDKKLLNQV